ncbi:ferrochelatase [Methylocapsa palsarum]|uniref:Ferrochelatase n=1 Tax=Methylocapsa palsarum TaxID=1612308 RepID=A0A1I3YL65_9HYPH|nr:ferrochelatase [Methylocapsa palsarum]SFK32572.1 ferrochelatase [Methylocapsa palsarum]
MLSSDALSSSNTPRSGKIGVLLVNLGTPDAVGYWPVRRYLKEFLSDPRVVDIPRIVWWPILNLIILNLRPQRSSKNYAEIWNRELNESPLKTTTRAQAEKLADWIRAGGLDPKDRPGAGAGRIAVSWAMRYGNPSIAGALESLRAFGCERILVAPLYPQYAAATWESAAEKVEECLTAMGWRPDLRITQPYFDDPTYIEALSLSLRSGISRLGFTPERILISFHGVPKSTIAKGDPYSAQCLETWRLLREHLGLSEKQCPVSFQSRFGRAEWLQPYTDETVRSLARQGVKNLAIAAPGFSADCLETIYELGVENRDLFKENGGENFAVIPCLNDSHMGMMLIRDLVARGMKGWL